MLGNFVLCHGGRGAVDDCLLCGFLCYCLLLFAFVVGAEDVLSFVLLLLLLGDFGGSLDVYCCSRYSE